MLITPQQRDKLEHCTDEETGELLMQLATECEEDGRIGHEVLTGMLEGAREGAGHAIHLLVDFIRVTQDPTATFEQILLSAAKYLGRNAAQYRSTDEMAAFIASLVPDWATSVLDPAVGWGTLLLAVSNKLSNRAKLLAADEYFVPWTVTAERLCMHGLSADMSRTDSLLSDSFYQMMCDVVVIDPPYGFPLGPDAEDASYFSETFEVSRPHTADLVWVDYATRHLTSRGRGFVVLPTAALARGGTDGRIRAELLRRGVIDAIIALPPNMAASTHIPLAIWVLRSRDSEHDRSNVVLINATDGDRSTKQPRDNQRTELLERASHHFRNWTDNPETYSPEAGVTAVVPILELLGKDVPLTPVYWTTLGETADPRPLVSAANESVRDLRTIVGSPPATMPDGLALSFDGHEPPARISLQALADSKRISWRRGIRIDRNTIQDKGNVPVLTPASLDVASPDCRPTGYLDTIPAGAEPTRPGDVVFLPQGRIRAVVDTRGGHLLASPLIGIRIHSGKAALPPAVLAALLSDDRIAALATGVASPAVPLKQVTIPILTETTAQLIGTAFEVIADCQIHAARLAHSSEATRQALTAALSAGATVTLETSG